MRTDFAEATIDDVFGFYVAGYKLPENTKIIRFDAIYDPRNGKVVFKLVLDDTEEKV